MIIWRPYTDIEKSIDDAIENAMDFKPNVLQAIEKIALPFKMNDTYESWLRIVPTEVYTTDAKLNNNKILMKGTKVRLKLEKPESIQGVKYKNDKFRATDIHWQVKPIYEIMESYLILGSPPMYRIKEVNSGKIFRGLVPYERLQVI
jgi:hypothetical protein